MPTNSSIALILPTYQDSKYAQQAALSFFEHTADPFLILIDDASDNCPFIGLTNWFDGIPRHRIRVICRSQNMGLTAALNDGLRISRELNCRHSVTANADILFTPRWEHGLIRALAHGYDLVGPVTNAPGHLNSDRQNIARFFSEFVLTDNREYLAKVAECLYDKFRATIAIPNRINGFLMCAETNRWWRGAYDATHVFNPAYRTVHNERELEDRWCQSGANIGFVPSSFIFHYRSVSRGYEHCTKGWFRTTFDKSH